MSLWLSSLFPMGWHIPTGREWASSACPACLLPLSVCLLNLVNHPHTPYSRLPGCTGSVTSSITTLVWRYLPIIYTSGWKKMNAQRQKTTRWQHSWRGRSYWLLLGWVGFEYYHVFPHGWRSLKQLHSPLAWSLFLVLLRNLITATNCRSDVGDLHIYLSVPFWKWHLWWIFEKAQMNGTSSHTAHLLSLIQRSKGNTSH